MAVHLFGGVWSASCANYGLQRTAKDNSDDFDPEVARSVENQTHAKYIYVLGRLGGPNREKL